MESTGKLIVVEGPDGVGKSTLAAELFARLVKGGVRCRSYAFPGNEPGTLGALVYRLHHDSSALGVNELAPVALQAAHVAAHLDAIERLFKKVAKAGDNIVLDRYWWSTAVYGSLGGASWATLNSLIDAERHCWGDVQPLVVFLIDRETPWRVAEGSPAWRSLANEYRTLAERERLRTPVEVITNDGAIGEAADRMAERVFALLQNRGDSKEINRLP